jgi:hypothetical protein
VRALNRFRPALHYRREVFNAGLSRAGYAVVGSLPDPGPGDALLIWNRYGQHHAEATRFESAGATVLVAENGYLGKDFAGGDWFALAKGHHNGAGQWPDGGPERWDSLGIEPAPWRTSGTDALVLPQRGIGEPGIAMPRSWPAGHYGRVRPHPGMGVSRPLANDLDRAKYAVTWGSGAALKALLYGVPVFHAFPKWIGAQAALPIDQLGSEPKRDDADRLAMFRRLAHAMWTLDEIATGEPFVRLREMA